MSAHCDAQEFGIESISSSRPNSTQRLCALLNAHAGRNVVLFCCRLVGHIDFVTAMQPQMIDIDTDLASVLANVTMSQAKKSSKGNFMCFMNTKSGGSFEFQIGAPDEKSNYCLARFGISDPYDGGERNDAEWATLPLFLHEGFDVSIIKALDEKVKQEGIRDQADLWFPDQKMPSKEVLDHMFTSPLKESTEPGRAHVLRVKVRAEIKDDLGNITQSGTKIEKLVHIKDGTIKVEPGSISDIRPGSSIFSIYQGSSTWKVAGNRLGWNLRVTHCIVDSSNSTGGPGAIGGFILRPGTNIVMQHPSVGEKRTLDDDSDVNAERGNSDIAYHGAITSQSQMHAAPSTGTDNYFQ